MAEKIKVLVDRTQKNYCAIIGEKINGVVIVTAYSLDELKSKVRETLIEHIDSLEDDVEDWMKSRDYELVYEFFNQNTHEKENEQIA